MVSAICKQDEDRRTRALAQSLRERLKSPVPSVLPHWQGPLSHWVWKKQINHTYPLLLYSPLWLQGGSCTWGCWVGWQRGAVGPSAPSPARGLGFAEWHWLCSKAANWSKLPIPFWIKLNVLLMGPEILMNYWDFFVSRTLIDSWCPVNVRKALHMWNGSQLNIWEKHLKRTINKDLILPQPTWW